MNFENIWKNRNIKCIHCDLQFIWGMNFIATAYVVPYSFPNILYVRGLLHYDYAVYPGQSSMYQPEHGLHSSVINPVPSPHWDLQ